MIRDLLLRDVTFPSGEVALAGTLGLPSGPTRWPGVVLVGGSGPADRDNGTLFPPIREHLLGAGLAVLSYDKRGVGGSSGSWLTATIDDLATDAIAAVEMLRGVPELDADAVGLFGHSEGGWVVLRAAAGRDDLAFVVTNAGPGMTPAEQDRHGLATVMRADACSEADIEACLAMFDRLVVEGRRGGDLAEVNVTLRGDPAYPLFEKYCGELDAPTWEFIKRKQDHDPVPDVVRLHCPHLALFGGADPLVPVVDSVAAFAAAACHPDRTGRSSLTVGVFPHGDHRIQVDGATRFAPGYLATVSRWIRFHCAPDSPGEPS